MRSPAEVASSSDCPGRRAFSVVAALEELGRVCGTPSLVKNRYYLMRHGESLANVADLIVSLPENGLEGYGLTQLGRQQARESALQSGLPASTLVIASDFLRTRHTADEACAALHAQPARLHPGLRERAFGQLEKSQGGDYHRVWAEDCRDPQHTLFGAESAATLAARLGAVLHELESEHENRDILLVSHGDPLRFLQLWAAGRPLQEHLELRLFGPAEIRPLGELPKEAVDRLTRGVLQVRKGA
jgi:probable phosphoglycerate mutase